MTPAPRRSLAGSRPPLCTANNRSYQQVPIPKVRGISEEELFKVVTTGKSKRKSWKRMVTKPTFVGQNFTRRYVGALEPCGFKTAEG